MKDASPRLPSVFAQPTRARLGRLVWLGLHLVASAGLVGYAADQHVGGDRHRAALTIPSPPAVADRAQPLLLGGVVALVASLPSLWLAHRLAASQRRERQWKAWLEQLPLGVRVVDAMGQPVWINPAGQQMLGEGCGSDGRPASMIQCGDVAKVACAGVPDLPWRGQSATGDRPISEERTLQINGQTVFHQVWTVPLVKDAGQGQWVMEVVQDVTERRRHEQVQANYAQELEMQMTQQLKAIRDNEFRLQNLVQTLPGTVYSVRLDRQTGLMQFEYINCTTEMLDEISVEQLLAKPSQLVLELMHPEDRPGCEAAIAKSTQTLSLFTYEWRLVLPSGQIKWVRAIAQPEQRHDGTLCWHGVAMDVTDRKRLEAALQASQVRLRDILNSAGAAIGSFRFYPNQTFVTDYHSIGCETVFGYTPEELTPEVWTNGIQIGDRESFYHQTFAAVAQEHPLTVEYPFRHKDGSLRWIADTLTSRWSEADQCWFVTAVGVDITDRKHAEESLRQSEAITRAILNALPDLIIRMKADGTYLDIKPTSAFPNIGTPDRVGQTIYHILPPEVAQQRMAAVETALQMQTIQVYEFPLTVEGVSLWQEARIIPLTADEVLVMIRDLTERRNAEDALRESEQFLRTIYDGIEAAVFIVDVLDNGDFRYVGTNPAHQRFSKLSSAELRGKSPEQVLTPDMARQVSARYRTCVVTGGSIAYEEKLVINGLESWWITNLTPLRDASSRIYRLIGTSFNITDRKRIEEALRESESVLRQLTENLPLLFGIRTLDYSRWLYVNLAFEKICGRPVQLIYDDPDGWCQFTHPDDVQRVMANQVLPSRPEPISQEFRIVRPDREIRWIRMMELPVDDAGGNPYRVAMIAEDITESRRTEEALRESEERFRRAFDDAPIGIALVSLEGRFVKVNRALCEIVGYSEAELLSITFQDITHPDDLPFDLEAKQHMLTGDLRVYQVEKRYLHKMGDSVHVLLSSSLVRDHSEQPLYFVTQVQDISDRHKVDRMKDEFISIVSHELRTPLTAIRGSLGLMDSGVLSDDPEQLKDMLQIAINNSDRLVRLVNDILDLERLESGNVPLVLEPCEVSALIDAAIESVQAIADDASIRLSTNACDAQIWVAPDAIIQALTNLLSNAIKFSPAGSRVEVSAVLVPDRNASHNRADPTETIESCKLPYICFAVVDEGRGIPHDKLETIFVRFQQVDVSDSRQKGGTGLGLTICKNIVQQHGGHIWAESTLGQGSTFYFTLPFAKNTVF